MRLAPLLLIVVAVAGGCTSGRLRQRTINQGSSLPELQYQQVLANLAVFAENPAALPWHVTLREGTTQITDSVSGGAAVDIGPPASTLPQLFGSRTGVGQWGMSPVVDATELRLLRFAYRRAVGVGEMPDPEFLADLGHEIKNQIPTNPDLQDESGVFYGYQAQASPTLAAFKAAAVTTNDADFFNVPGRPLADRSPLARNAGREVEVIRRDLARINPGWFHTGGRRDVPRDACYVGRSGDRYAWVCADGREQLTEFTLTVLRFAALVKEAPTLNTAGSVKFSPGDRGG